MDNTILLVDDEAGIRKVLGISLQDSGYDVHTAENGQEALRLFKEIDPPIVLTDIKMPDIDGIELLRRIKEEDPDTEVIMFTGHGDMDLAIKSLKHDATDFVTKPINDEVLDIALKRAQERIALRRQLREYTLNLEKLVAEKAQKLIEAERLAAVGQTVSELSHAIKSIANGLKGGIFVLGKGIELDNKQYLHEGWKMVEGNVDKIKNLSLDLLNYGRYADIALVSADANAPVLEVVQLLEARAKEEGIALKVELSDQLSPLQLDPEGIHRCLLNIVTNAMDACEGDDITNKTVTIRTLKPEGWAVEYQVIDSGAGMTADVRDRIFQSFFSTKGSRGTGIGLMMTKKIVDQHQGVIKVTSEQAAGTTVIIKLPRRE